MITKYDKVYVQLQPTKQAEQLLLNYQSILPEVKGMRLVTRSSLHLTVVHIGSIYKFLDSLVATSSLSEQALLIHIDTLVTKLAEITKKYAQQEFLLPAVTSARFGENGTTYVITFHATELLRALHQLCLDSLVECLQSCGIKNPIQWMQTDDNLRYALQLRPHVTIAKFYTGPHIQPVTTAAAFSLMPVVYPSVLQ